MKFGTSLLLTIGALMLLVTGTSAKAASGRRLKYLRSTSHRELYNYSSNKGYYYSAQQATDDAADADAATDDYNEASSYSYSNNGQDGSSYNGRDQSWAGQSVQWSYDDKYEPEVTITTYQDRKFSGFSFMEAFATVSLIVLLAASLGAYIALQNGFNVIHLYQVYIFRGVFGHKDIDITATDTGETGETEEGFVKLEDA